MKNKIKIHKIYTETVYKTIHKLSTPIIFKTFHPIILNNNNIPKNEPIILAPNHRTTLDPFVVTAGLDNPIHWLALKRFFDGEDSIFNNSKNPVLCKTTSLLFKNIGAVPFDREGNNIGSIKVLINYLRMNGTIGVFPEGGTNKKPEERDINEIKISLMNLSRSTDAWIIPISIIWIPKEAKIKNKVIVNFREPYKSNGMSPNEAAEIWYSSIRSGLEENKKIIKNLQEIEGIILSEEEQKTLELKMK